MVAAHFILKSDLLETIVCTSMSVQPRTAGMIKLKTFSSRILWTDLTKKQNHSWANSSGIELTHILQRSKADLNSVQKDSAFVVGDAL